MHMLLVSKMLVTAVLLQLRAPIMNSFLVLFKDYFDSY